MYGKITPMCDLRRPFGYLGRLFGTFWTVLSLYWLAKRWQRTPSHLTKRLPYAYIDWEEETIITRLQKWWEERGVSTVSCIVEEVSQVLVNHLWNNCVSVHMPDSTEAFKEKILDMEELWQFPCCWAAIDGCHIPIKCPPGGLKACKEHHNFKNFYSIVLMAMVDSKYRFVGGSCGFLGNSHDAIIFKSTNLWDSLQNRLLPTMGKTKCNKCKEDPRSY